MPLSILTWNINSVRLRIDNVGRIASELQPDVICLQETKAEEHQSEVDLPEYEEYWNSAQKKGYSGTAIFTKIKPISVIIGLPED